jgi:WD40 repeat protein
LAATLANPAGSGGSAEVTSVAFSPDGKTLTIADGNGSAYLVEVATGRVAATLTDPNRTASSGEGVNSVAFSPDGKLLASGDADNSTYVWDIG